MFRIFGIGKGFGMRDAGFWILDTGYWVMKCSGGSRGAGLTAGAPRRRVTQGQLADNYGQIFCALTLRRCVTAVNAFNLRGSSSELDEDLTLFHTRSFFHLYSLYYAIAG